MSFILKRLLKYLVIGSVVFPLSLDCQPSSLEQRIKKIISTVPGQIGVSALHIESGERFEVNAYKRFPMASTAKLPLMLYCLSLVDQGVLGLEQKEIFTPYDMRRGCYRIIPNKSYSIKDLIKLSIEVSDNVAPDKILKLVGGAKAVTAWLKQNGIYDMSVDRSIFRLLADFAGVTLVDEDHCTIQHYNKCLNHVSKKDRLKAEKKFYDDERDTATPRAMVDLLDRMYRGKLVSEDSKKFLLECMMHCKRGDKRIKRYLPKGTKFWHKTGRIDGIDSDVGIIELPRDRGHLVLAMYSNRSTSGEAKREKAFARIGQALFKHFSL